MAGALLFLASESLIAEQRFVKDRAWQPVAIVVSPNHLALIGLEGSCSWTVDQPVKPIGSVRTA